MVMMAAAYSTAAMTASTIPGVKPPDWPVSSATPPMATSALTAVTALGSLCRSTASVMGTRMMAVFSSRETVEEGGALEPRQLRGEHQEKQTAHDGATHQRMALDVAQALEKHHRQQHKGHQKPGRQQVEDPMPFMAILLNRRDVARAAITAAKRISAFF